jgi:hypothetical protein
MNTSVMMRCPKCKQASELCNLHLLDKSFKRTWVWLTDEEIAELALQEQLLLICDDLESLTQIVRAAEEALRAKNSTLACIPAVPPG